MQESLAEQQAAIFEILATRYPEAQEAMEHSGMPMDVDDSELRERIYTDYITLLKERMARRTHSLVTELEAKDISVTTYAGMPSFAAELPKRLIQEVARGPDVAKIYLIEGKLKSELDSAVPTSRASAVWEQGFDGTGVTIGIIEPRDVDFNNNFLNFAPVWRPGANTAPDLDHSTLVASSAASFHETYKGVAPNATILSAGFDGDISDAVTALQWAFENGADVVNYSGGLESNDLHWSDKAFDYWAAAWFRPITKSAGNTGGSITSPGKAWNIITVGAFSDMRNANWSDDVMWQNSAHIDPVSDHSDREKPEVVAVGDIVTGLGINNNPVSYSGTSYAAAQVAGLAALLIDRDDLLESHPTALKAIVMASAVHNIEGDSDLSDKDGAGGIDAALALTAAEHASYNTICTSACWWAKGINNDNFPVGTTLNRYFKANRGERIRVVISWLSHPDCPDQNNCNYDRLDTDLDLQIQDMNGNLVPNASSTSFDNNYEIVEFTALYTGQYDISVYKYRADEFSNYLGIAWVKDATYLPDLRNKDGWVSRFYVRNDGAEHRNVTINYFDTNGDPTPQESDVCGLAPNQSCWIPVTDFDRIPSGTTGSAILDSGEDVSVIVVTDNDSAGKTYSYEGIPSTGERSQIGPGDELFIPAYRRGRYGYDSWLTVQNVNTESADTTFTFYNDAGNQVQSTSYDISAGG